MTSWQGATTEDLMTNESHSTVLSVVYTQPFRRNDDMTWLCCSPVKSNYWPPSSVTSLSIQSNEGDILFADSQKHQGAAQSSGSDHLPFLWSLGRQVACSDIVIRIVRSCQMNPTKFCQRTFILAQISQSSDSCLQIHAPDIYARQDSEYLSLKNLSVLTMT